MLWTYVADFGSTGRPRTSACQTLSAGNMGQAPTVVGGVVVVFLGAGADGRAGRAATDLVAAVVPVPAPVGDVVGVVPVTGVVEGAAVTEVVVGSGARAKRR